MVVRAVSCEPVSLLFGQYQGEFRKKQRSGGPEFGETPAAQGFVAFSANNNNRE